MSFFWEIQDTVVEWYQGWNETRTTFYEIDKEFELMTKRIEKNFVKVDRLMVFMCDSLRQTLIVKLSKVGKDKEAWGKPEDHLTGRSVLFRGTI